MTVDFVACLDWPTFFCKMETLPRSEKEDAQCLYLSLDGWFPFSRSTHPAM